MKRSPRYSNVISSFEDLKGFDKVEFVVLYEESLAYDDGYPSTHKFLQIEGFENEEQLKEWIHSEMKPHAYGRSPRKFKILKWNPIEPTIQVNIDLGQF